MTLTFTLVVTSLYYLNLVVTYAKLILVASSEKAGENRSHSDYSQSTTDVNVRI